MPRLVRIVVAGALHHVTQRGNDRAQVFFDDGDRQVYLKLLRTQSFLHGLRLHGWCLMTNHVHLVVEPSNEASLARAVGRAHFLYTQHVNGKQGRSGHLWQNRFYSCALDDAHALAALCYVERNPVRAKMCRVPARYPWSSAGAHCGGVDTTGLLDLVAWRKEWPGERWTAQLEAMEMCTMEEPVRRHTATGRPLGSAKFLNGIAARTGRRVVALAVGRPRTQEEK